MNYLCASLASCFKSFNVVITMHAEANFLTNFYIYILVVETLPFISLTEHQTETGVSGTDAVCPVPFWFTPSINAVRFF